MIRRPRLLDLFCGAGGAAMGYHHAGFDVYGVDIKPQPNYPFTFWQRDVLTLSTQWMQEEFDVVHASPPCQAYTRAQTIWKREHPKLIEPVRTRLQESGLPYIIENVVGAPLHDPVTLCGTAFDLRVQVKGMWFDLQRHRLFEASIVLTEPTPRCAHEFSAMGVYGHGDTKPMRLAKGWNASTASVRREVMQMPWANRDEIAQAIPPAYTEYLGRQLLAHLNTEVVGQ